MVALRYQALIPLMYLTLIVEYATRLAFSHIKPITLEGLAPGGVANYVAIPLFVLMLVLSLRTEDVSSPKIPTTKPGMPYKKSA